MTELAILRNSKVLIIDDQISNTELLENFLQFQEYTNIRSITDPRLAMDMIAAYDPDLILLDLMMPYLSGYEILEKIRKTFPSDTYLPVLVLTADISQDAKQRALHSGASDFLSKPFDLIEVGLRIRNLLEVRHLNNQLKNQNIFLEEKVRERTRELETANSQLVAAKEKAEASDRLKTSFIQTISHEIRTPLNGIIGCGSLLADPEIGEQEKQLFLDQMTISGNRLINTITDYLDISLIVSGSVEVTPTPTDLKIFMIGMKEKIIPFSKEKNLGLFLVLPENGHKDILNTDPELLEKIMIHLLSNAVKFTKKGSVTFGYSVNAGMAEIFIRDTGIGIRKEDQSRIFGNFIQADPSANRAYEGNGLGLSIVQGLTGLLGGEIRLESEEGTGTICYLTFPINV